MDGSTGSMLTLILPMVALVGVFYFLSIRPQRKREKEQKELRNSIEVGDEITTIGGIVGRVVSVKEDTFVLETAGERSRIRFKRWAIQTVGKLALETGTEGSAVKDAAEK